MPTIFDLNLNFFDFFITTNSQKLIQCLPDPITFLFNKKASVRQNFD